MWLEGREGEERGGVRKMHKGQTMPGPECHGKESRSYYEGDRDAQENFK